MFMTVLHQVPTRTVTGNRVIQIMTYDTWHRWFTPSHCHWVPRTHERYICHATTAWYICCAARYHIVNILWDNIPAENVSAGSCLTANITLVSLSHFPMESCIKYSERFWNYSNYYLSKKFKNSSSLHRLQQSSPASIARSDTEVL